GRGATDAGCDVLLAIQLIGDRGGIDSTLRVIAPQYFAVLGVEGEQRVAVAVAHEHQVAGSGEHTTGPAWTTFGFPDHFTTHGIPGLQPAVVGFLVVRLQRGAVDTTTEGDQRRRTFGRHLLRR